MDKHQGETCALIADICANPLVWTAQEYTVLRPSCGELRFNSKYAEDFRSGARSVWTAASAFVGKYESPFEGNARLGDMMQT